MRGNNLAAVPVLWTVRNRQGIAGFEVNCFAFEFYFHATFKQVAKMPLFAPVGRHLF